MNLIIVGDIMPGGVLPYQDEYISNDLLNYISSFDCRIGTLECALGDDLPFDKTKMEGRKNIIYSPTKEINRLKSLGFNVVSLANNHVYDLGEAGLKLTIKLLDDAGIKHCGAGTNLEEASKPAVVSIDNKSLAILSYCQYDSVYLGYVEKATPIHAGVNPLDIDRCIEEIRKAKSIYDYVIVIPHWGIEYQYFPTPQCVDYAKRMIDAGADGVFASHPHQIQPMIKYKDKPIAFSMGNFMFPDYYMTPPRPIWYPEDIKALQNLPRYNYYPKHIDTPCLQVWNHISRIGMIIDCEINSDTIKAVYKLIYSTKDNIVEFYSNPLPVSFRLKWMSAAVGSNHFKSIYLSYQSRYNLIRRGYHFLNRYIKYGKS